jgi:hypothetical protein
MSKRRKLNIAQKYFKLNDNDKTNEPYAKSLIDPKSKHVIDSLAKYQYIITHNEMDHMNLYGANMMKSFTIMIRDGTYVTLTESVILQVESGPKIMRVEEDHEIRNVEVSETIINRVAVGYIRIGKEKTRIKTSYIIFRLEDYVYTLAGVVYKLEYTGESLQVYNKYHTVHTRNGFK